MATKPTTGAASRPVSCTICGVKHRSKTSEQCADERMSEKTLQDRVIDRAKRRGWKVAHAGRGFVGGSEDTSGQWITPMMPGWPDLTLIKPGHSLIFMELKREKGVLEDVQVETLQLLNQTGNVAVVIRPSDLRLGRVNTILSGGRPLGG